MSRNMLRQRRGLLDVQDDDDNEYLSELPEPREQHQHFPLVNMTENNSFINGTFANETLAGGAAAVAGADAADVFTQFFMWTLFTLFCVALRANNPTEAIRVAERDMEAQREARLRRLNRKKDPEFRKGVMDRSLITKKVLSQDEQDHSLALGDDAPPTVDGTSVSITSIESDENSPSCMICLDTFRVGDEVTWAGMDSVCRHVFHSECIEGWLAKHDDCPSCRTQLIDLDAALAAENGGKGDDDDDMTFPPKSSMFVIAGGLVRQVSRRASSYFVGQSIEVKDPAEDDEEDSELNSSLSSGLDLEKSPIGVIGKALRRVSSGLYSSISHPDLEDMGDADEEEEDVVLDEGIVLSDADDAPSQSVGHDEVAHPPMDTQPEAEQSIVAEQSLLQRVGLRRVSSGRYARVQRSVSGGLSEAVQEEEDDLEMQDTESEEIHNSQMEDVPGRNRNGLLSKLREARVVPTRRPNSRHFQRVVSFEDVALANRSHLENTDPQISMEEIV